MAKGTIKLGSHVKDMVSGFEGVVTARVEFLNGCVQYCIRPAHVEKDGTLNEGVYFDSQQVALIAEVHKNVRSVVQRNTGGPSHRPGRTMDRPPR